MGKFLEDLKKDKKKGMFLILGVGGLLLVIVMGLFFGKSGTTTEQKAKIESDIIVPVDTVAINKGESVPQNENSDFFNSETTTEQTSVVDLKENNVVKQKQVYVPKPKNYYSSSVTTRQSSTNQQKKQQVNYVAPVEVASAKRRRSPNDGLSNYTSTANNKTMHSAVIANDNKLVKSGSYVSIRIAEDITIGGVVLKRNSIVSGIASAGAERMTISIQSVKVNNVITAVKWEIIDEDGNLGIPIPESVLTDIATGSASDGIDKGSSKVEANVPVLGNVKVNLKKKVKEVSFVINNGHKVYIKEKTN